MSIENCIHIENIYKSYKKQNILNDISFDVIKGEIFGLLGPSGAGKTTLIRLLMGMEYPNSGQIEIMGNKVPDLKTIEKIGYTAQADALYTDLTCEENMKFYCQLYKIPKKECSKNINEALKVVNLNEDLKKIVSTFSGGMKRRLSLAISLVNSPKILVLDEPTVGMDPVLRKQIWLELENLKNSGVSIIITTHVMDEAMKCDRVAMLRDGNCISLGKPSDLIKEYNCNDLEEVFLKLGGDKDEN